MLNIGIIVMSKLLFLFLRNIKIFIMSCFIKYKDSYINVIY